MESPIKASARVIALERLPEPLPDMVRHARDAMLPVVITEDGQPIAAIVDIRELRHLYDLKDASSDQQIIRAFEAAEARDQVEWMSHEEMLAFQQQLLANAERQSRAKAKKAGDQEGAGE